MKSDVPNLHLPWFGSIAVIILLALFSGYLAEFDSHNIPLSLPYNKLECERHKILEGKRRRIRYGTYLTFGRLSVGLPYSIRMIKRTLLDRVWYEWSYRP